MKLLLVEDNPTMQTTLQRSLSRRGMEVATCGDGGLALEKWPAFQPDVVVLDLTLPGLDGLQVLQRARGMGWATPVLILTARGSARWLGAPASAPPPATIPAHRSAWAACGTTATAAPFTAETRCWIWPRANWPCCRP